MASIKDGSAAAHIRTAAEPMVDMLSREADHIGYAPVNQPRLEVHFVLREVVDADDQEEVVEEPSTRDIIRDTITQYAFDKVSVDKLADAIVKALEGRRV
ncbi:hypothetical protein [Microvirga pudoricolor]|uniref:hypothetical protein n=1 Tax=Microvirga pudoricolor TaxID=2778729 RepID=UPI00195172D8|nr:hypothetical protein [Microvirga pudoricolor]MBM6595570.1 hypothetical protein [Microvirga pudoricolor]